MLLSIYEERAFHAMSVLRLNAGSTHFGVTIDGKKYEELNWSVWELRRQLISMGEASLLVLFIEDIVRRKQNPNFRLGREDASNFIRLQNLSYAAAYLVTEPQGLYVDEQNNARIAATIYVANKLKTAHFGPDLRELIPRHKFDQQTYNNIYTLLTLSAYHAIPFGVTTLCNSITAPFSSGYESLTGWEGVHFLVSYIFCYMMASTSGVLGLVQKATDMLNGVHNEDPDRVAEDPRARGKLHLVEKHIASKPRAKPTEAILKKIQEIDASTLPTVFVCPINHTIMWDPVSTVTGHVYERAMIEEWFTKNDTDPSSNLIVRSKELVPLYGLRETCERIINNYNAETAIELRDLTN